MPAAASDQQTQLLHEYIASCSNWGRWGTDDEVGALNLVGPAEVMRAAGLVKKGTPISLTLPYDQAGPQPGGFRNNPQLLLTATGTDHVGGAQDPLPGGFGPSRGFGFSDDVLVMPTQSGTQWDSLSHIFWEGRMFNGRPADQVNSRGAAANGIENYTGRIVMPGVLIDMPAHRGVDALEPGDAIEAAEIAEFLADHDLTVQPGDALLVRTGFMAARRGNWGDYAGGAAPGLSLHLAPWLHSHDIAAVATDTWGVEVRPNQIDYFQPLHIVSLVHGGIAFGEMFDLDALAADCAQDGVYTFMFVASPLPITGASGAPVSALAIK
ncbi:cyclase family protein [Amycolatopsis pithecellobii]|uniref:Cyclase family protein n=1 Tax=Amycolatopsis pithecellobii TaxID=664692 RepID=A0A6N7Z547_9PSEU|nr:cyclase family protein [Amycolatopsis pithecellobii]MTD55624.1 cyclase family protein [Amycolatopsis pithecellobii]